MATRRAARERALGLAYESELRGVTRPIAARGAAGRARRVRVPLVLGVDEHREEIDALIAQVLRALVARAHAGRSTARCCASAPTSSRGCPRRRPARSSPKRSSSRSSTRRRTRADSSTGCSRGSPRTSGPEVVDPVEASDAAPDIRRDRRSPTPSRSCSATTTRAPTFRGSCSSGTIPSTRSTYVIFVFQKLFGYSRAKASKLTQPGALRGQGRRRERHAREVRGRRRPAARVRSLGDDAEGRLNGAAHVQAGARRHARGRACTRRRSSCSR